MRQTAILAAAALIGAALPIRAQNLVEQIHQTKNGEVWLGFETEPDVCGDGAGMIQSGDHHMRTEGNSWGRACLHGPARVVLRMSDGRVTKVKTYVGPDWPKAGSSVTDLGLVNPEAGAKALVTIAAEGTAAADAIFPATIANDVVIWPDLLTLAKRKEAPEESRKQAIFWLGQAAGDKATEGLSELAEDDDAKDVRESAVFALSQLQDGGGVPSLIRLAKSSPHPDVRRKALFWLGQSEDPRAVSLFEEILTGSR
jgi:hypothetical protein